MTLPPDTNRKKLEKEIDQKKKKKIDHWLTSNLNSSFFYGQKVLFWGWYE